MLGSSGMLGLGRVDDGRQSWSVLMLSMVDNNSTRPGSAHS